jgi:hypothetical protein
MRQPGYSYVLGARLEPVCPRDNKIMRYEPSGLPSGTDNRPFYRCGYEGCSVRYDLANGYFTLIGMPDQINPAEEPGVNTLKCEKHGVWLHRRKDQAKEGVTSGVAVLKGASSQPVRDSRSGKVASLGLAEPCLVQTLINGRGDLASSTGSGLGLSPNIFSMVAKSSLVRMGFET